MAPSILVIDDDLDATHIIHEILTEEGYDVAQLNTSARSYATCAAKRPDLVLLDVYMPGRDGIEILLELKEHWPDLPVIAFSAHYEMQDVMVRLGAAAFLFKPINRQTWLDEIQRVLTATGTA